MAKIMTERDKTEDYEDYLDSLELKEAVESTRDENLIPLDEFWKQVQSNQSEAV